MPKERDTVILPVRIKKTLRDAIDQRVSCIQDSRNAWVTKAIQDRLRNRKGHKNV